MLHFNDKVCCKEITAVCYTSVTTCAAKRLQQYVTLQWQSMLQRDYSCMLHFCDKVCCKEVTAVCYTSVTKYAAKRLQLYVTLLWQSVLQRGYSSMLHFNDKVCCKEITAVCYTSVTKCAAKRLQQYVTLQWQSMLQRDYNCMLHFSDKVCCNAVTAVCYTSVTKCAAKQLQQYINSLKLLHRDDNSMKTLYCTSLRALCKEIMAVCCTSVIMCVAKQLQQEVKRSSCCTEITAVWKHYAALHWHNLEQRDNSSDLLDFFRDFPASTSESALSLQHQHSVLTPDCSWYRSHGGPSPAQCVNPRLFMLSIPRWTFPSTVC